MASIRTGYLSVVGNYRENNEDCVVVDEQQRFLVVADGMGGQVAGERASAMAVETFPQRLCQLLDFQRGEKRQILEAIDTAVSHANSEIMALSEGDPSLRNMGTTIVFLVRVGARFFIGGVGDSRAYLYRNEKLTQLTTDHTLTQALLDAGTITEEDAKNHKYRNVLYRYLGSREGGTGVNATEITPQQGDRYLLCSDGVTDGLKEPQLASLLTTGSEPQVIAERIVKAALDGGSRDNVSCIVTLVE
ncbi:MAG: serine/threonine-protein phosphatase [Planctomycetaceae bacterium]|nr:serine/threonine-protein phosphatase [Planctomycetaceae bacterium]